MLGCVRLVAWLIVDTLVGLLTPQPVTREARRALVIPAPRRPVD